MNKVAHYNGFVGRCQQYGLTKQAADMLYKQALFGQVRRLFKTQAPNFKSNGWAPVGALTPNDKPWLNRKAPTTSIPHAPYEPGRDSIEAGGTWGLSPDRYGVGDEVDTLGAGMSEAQKIYSRANPNFAGWFNAHKKSLNKVVDKYPEVNRIDFRKNPEIVADMSKTYHDSMYNLTNGTPRVSAPAPSTPGTSRGRSYDF